MKTPDAKMEALLRGRHIATLGTESNGGGVHLTAVWYLFEGGHLFVATSSKSRKAKNVMARRKASLMVDVRKPATERGVTAAGSAEIVSGDESRQINGRIHQRYM